jgi:hypothetical protein
MHEKPSGYRLLVAVTTINLQRISSPSVPTVWFTAEKIWQLSRLEARDSKNMGMRSTWAAQSMWQPPEKIAKTIPHSHLAHASKTGACQSRKIRRNICKFQYDIFLNNSGVDRHQSILSRVATSFGCDVSGCSRDRLHTNYNFMHVS